MMAWMEALVAAKGSDLHLKVGSPPRMRVDGNLVVLDGPTLTPEAAETLLRELIRPDLHEQFQRTNEADFAYSLPGVGRFRVNAFRQRGSVGLVLRRVQEGAMSIAELGLPPVIARLAEQPRGLVLVTGPTGSGKTTTLAAMIDHVNANRAVHIVTIEDPIEVLHADKLGMVNQREVRVDTDDFTIAMRAAMRQDPDVILVGEVRDSETLKNALAAAETGHLVLSTLHTTDAAETVNRCIDLFPPFQQRQVRLSLAAALRGIGRPAPGPPGRRRRPHRRPRGHGQHRPNGRSHRRRRAHRRPHLDHGRKRLLRHADLRPAPHRPLPRRPDRARRRPRRRLQPPRPPSGVAQQGAGRLGGLARLCRLERAGATMAR
jgi:twitching motility protein PilT